MMLFTHVIYFDGISSKYHLDKAAIQYYYRETGNFAKLYKKGVKKVEKCYKTILMDNIKTFATYLDANDWAVKFGLSVEDYTPFGRTNIFEWRIK